MEAQTNNNSNNISNNIDGVSKLIEHPRLRNAWHYAMRVQIDAGTLPYVYYADFVKEREKILTALINDAYPDLEEFVSEKVERFGYIAECKKKGLTTDDIELFLKISRV